MLALRVVVHYFFGLTIDCFSVFSSFTSFSEWNHKSLKTMEINKSQRNSSEVKDDIYEVQEIVGIKKEGDMNLYRVRWKGYGPQSDTWEPQSNLRSVWKMVEKYSAKINKTPIITTRRRGRPSNSATLDNIKDDSIIKGIKRENKPLTKSKLINDTKIVNKKKIKNNLQEKSKDTFWKDLEDGKIDVFKEDLYSRVKSRASSRGNSMENSPKQSKDFDKCWPQSDSNDSENTDHYMDSDIRLKYCKTEALIAAIKDCDLEMAKILIKNGSVINSTFGNKSGCTPLMIACEMNNVELTQLLLMHGAVKDIQNKNGDTALIIACRLGFEEIIKLLLNYGSNFAVVNKLGMNALRIAKTNSSKNIQDILVDHISKLTISLESQVMNMLCNTAKIVNALFPIQCYSISEGKAFKLLFAFDLEKRQQSGVGYILFVANASISNTDIDCKLSGPNTVQEVVLNGIPQKPLTEGAQFVFSFLPLLRGNNELILKTIEANDNKINLLVCAYEAKLITDSHYYNEH